MNWMFRALFLVFLAAHCPAEDIRLSSGKTLANAESIRKENDGITYIHSEGITKIFFRELPRETRKEFTDVIYEDETVIIDFNYPTESPSIQQTLFEAAQEKLAVLNGRPVLKKSLYTISGVMQSNIAQNTYLLDASAIIRSERIFDPDKFYTLYVEATGTYTVTDSREEYTDDIIAIRSQVDQCAPSNTYLFGGFSAAIQLDSDIVLAEGDSFSCLAKNSGFYEYTTVAGAYKRIHHYLQVPWEDAYLHKQLVTEEVTYPLYNELIVHELSEMDFMELLKSGTKFRSSAMFKTPCSDCNESGQQADPLHKVNVSIPCPSCGGKGSIYRAVESHSDPHSRTRSFGSVQSSTKTISNPCHACNGTGKVTSKQPAVRACAQCNGQGFVSSRRGFVCRWEE